MSNRLTETKMMMFIILGNQTLLIKGQDLICWNQKKNEMKGEGKEANNIWIHTYMVITQKILETLSKRKYRLKNLSFQNHRIWINQNLVRSQLKDLKLIKTYWDQEHKVRCNQNTMKEKIHLKIFLMGPVRDQGKEAQ